MKSLIRTTMALVALTAATAGVAVAQQGSIGVLDSDRIGRQAPSLQAARQQLQRDTILARIEREAEAELGPMQEEFQRLIQEFQQQQGMMTPEVRQQREQRLQQRQIALQRTGQEYEEQAQLRQQQILGPALEQVNNVIDQLRRERGLSVILDRASVVSVAEDLDITDEVLRRLTAQANQG
jgi:outer membrane protein